MSNIEQNLQKILTSRYGKDVRQSIHDSIHDCYEDGKAGATDLVAREQIANLVANNNPTEGNSELVDIRVGANGKTYNSAGEAVREQFSDMYNTLYSVRLYPMILGTMKYDAIPCNLKAGTRLHVQKSAPIGDSSWQVNLIGRTALGELKIIVDGVFSTLHGGSYVTLAEDYVALGLWWNNSVTVSPDASYYVDVMLTKTEEEEEEEEYKIRFDTSVPYSNNILLDTDQSTVNVRSLHNVQFIKIRNGKTVNEVITSFNLSTSIPTLQTNFNLYVYDVSNENTISLELSNQIKSEGTWLLHIYVEYNSHDDIYYIDGISKGYHVSELTFNNNFTSYNVFQQITIYNGKMIIDIKNAEVHITGNIIGRVPYIIGSLLVKGPIDDYEMLSGVVEENENLYFLAVDLINNKLRLFRWPTIVYDSRFIVLAYFNIHGLFYSVFSDDQTEFYPCNYEEPEPSEETPIKIMCLGDSITALNTGDRGWIKYFMEKVNSTLVANVAVNSAVLPDYSDSVYDGNPTSSSQHNNVLGNQVQKILNQNYEAPDVILIAIGTNSGINITEEQMIATYYGETGGDLIPLSSVDRKTHAGAYRYCLETLHNKYPDALIVWCTPIMGYESTRSAEHACNWAESLRIATQYTGQLLCETLRCGINGVNEKKGELGEYLQDGLHPSVKGAKKIGYYNASFVKSHLDMVKI